MHWTVQPRHAEEDGQTSAPLFNINLRHVLTPEQSAHQLTPWRSPSVERLPSRLFPQSLHVVGYLSQLGGAGKMAAVAPWAMFVAAVPQPVAGMQGAANQEQVVALDVSVQSTHSSTALPPMRFSLRADDAAGDRVEWRDRNHASAPQALASEWLERHVRLTHFQSATTLWIRDYRLDANQQRELTEQVLTTLDSQLPRIHRVVVNGRQAWLDAPATTQPHEDSRHGR